MDGHRRNDPCPCGSGTKAKRCCGVRSGPSEEQLARAFLAGEAHRAAPVLAGVSELELRRLFDRLIELPDLDLSLVLSLPRLLAPELSRLLEVIAADDLDAGEEALPAARGRVDTVATRVSLARAVLALEDAGRIEPRLAALALLDLAGGDALLTASLVKAAAIATGAERTPGGLLVAA